MKNNFTTFKKQIAIALILLFTNLVNGQVTTSFTYTMGAAGTVSFTNLSSSTATTMAGELWSIYENTVPNQPGGTSIVHTFTANGNYLVRLVAFDQLNNADSTQSIITVTNTACVANANFGFWSPSPTNWNAYLWTLGNVVAASWNWGDSSPNSSGLTPSHTYSVAGNYNVCVSFTNACGSSTTICKSQFFSRTESSAMQYLNIISTNPGQSNLMTGINTLTKESSTLLIYPNPSNGEFTIKGIEGKVEIINSIGQTVYTSEFNGDELKVSGLAVGVYYLRMENSGVNRKIVVVN